MLHATGTRRLADAIVREIEPVSPARLACAAHARGERTHALLDSALASDAWSRWSTLALEPSRASTFGDPDSNGANPWLALDVAWLSDHAAGAGRGAGGDGPGKGRDAVVPPFRGGFMVALSYDAARLLPDFAPWSVRAEDDRPWPWLDVRTVGDLVATHEASGRSFLVLSTHPVFGDAEARLERLAARVDALRGALGTPAPHASATIAPTPAPGAALRSNMSDAEYARSFDRLQEYLRAGDLYQANLTRRFDAPYGRLPGELYESLRAAAPAPYGAWFSGTWGEALSASPELFLARTGNRIVTRPIKGTRPRRLDPAADAEEARALTASAKDRAEHVMIVDVHRNDLGRVCEFGSVRVETLAGLEAFPTVHHLTSTIVGTSRAGVSPWQAIAAAFPAGSITGAPKRRAIEVIEELEPTRRELYCGSIGWIGFDGDFALNVAIRTILLSEGTATFQAGGGIVIDSECAAEAEETWNKARALYAAIAPEAETAS